jgi:hypothetical protein
MAGDERRSDIFRVDGAPAAQQAATPVEQPSQAKEREFKAQVRCQFWDCQLGTLVSLCLFLVHSDSSSQQDLDCTW